MGFCGSEREDDSFKALGCQSCQRTHAVCLWRHGQKKKGRKRVQEVLEEQKKKSKSSGVSDPPPPKKPPNSVTRWPLTHHHSLSGVLQKAGMQRPALQRRLLDRGRLTDSFTTAGRTTWSSQQQRKEGNCPKPNLNSCPRLGNHLYTFHILRTVTYTSLKQQMHI